MRALFVAHRLPDHKIENEVAARLHRQRRLEDEEFPLELAAVIDEAALRKQVGGKGVMRDQLRHLAKCAELPTVTIQVLPDAGGGHTGTTGAYTILTFPEGDPALLHVAYVTGALQMEKPEELAQARLRFDQLRSEALSPRDSVALIERLAREL
jgi:hypothetical protein